jgi:hypothetical protein
MDTIESSVPAGNEGATLPQDTTAIDTQTATTPDAVSAPEGHEAGQSTEETLLAGKYKSPQELEKAYKELEGKIGSLGQKASVADLLEEKYGVTPQQLQDIVAQQEQARQQAQYEANPGAYAFQEVQSLKQQLALQAETAQLDAFIKENPDYAPFRDDIQEFAFLPKYHNTSYEDIAKEKFGKAIAQGQQSAYKKIETKQMSQMTPTAGVAQKKFSVEDMRGMTAAELEAILPHSGN